MLVYDMAPDYFGETDGSPLFDEDKICKNACISDLELLDYLDDGCKNGYAWHIKNLEIFDKHKELSEFYKDYDVFDTDCNGRFAGNYNVLINPITKAPQSYMYVYTEGGQ